MQAYAAQQYTMHQYAHQLSRPKQQQQQLSLQQQMSRVKICAH